MGLGLSLVKRLAESIHGRIELVEPPSGLNVLSGTIRDASYIGVSTQYVIETRNGSHVSVYEQNVERTIHGSLHRPGEAVRLGWSPDHTFAVGPSVAEAPAGE